MTTAVRPRSENSSAILRAATEWGTRAELVEVVALARAGAVRVEAEVFPLSAAPGAIDRLRAGRLDGRAVLVPD